MKILTIIQCSNLGGMEKATLEWLCILKEAGHEVLVFSLQPVGALKHLADDNGIPLAGSGKYKLLGFGNVIELLHFINQSAPDRLWLVGHNFASLAAAKLSGIPSYLSIHFHHCERPICFWRFFYGVAKRVCSSIHFVSLYIYEEVDQFFDSRNNVVCFPNVFREPEDTMSKTTALKRIGISDDAFVVGNAGWLIPRKAFDVFLHTAEIIKKRIPEAVFVIAGDGPERAHLEELSKELNIADSVKFVGWREDLTPFFRALDILLFNSNFDALGRTPVEALCYGVPVVASVTNGGLGEFIRHEKDGYIIGQHDHKKLAEEVYKVYSTPEYRSKITNTGKAHVLSIGSPERHLEHLKKFLNLE